MSYELIINIDTYSNLESWSIGEEILSPIFSHIKLTPQKIATFGEVTARQGVKIDHIDQCKDHWALKATMRIDDVSAEFRHDFHWKRSRSVKSEGHIEFCWKSSKGKKIPGGIFFLSQYDRKINWFDLFKKWCLLSAPYAAILHHIGPEDKIRSVINKNIRECSFEEEVQRNAWSRFLLGNLQAEFRAGELNSRVSGLTNLGWATWFGDDLAKEVNAGLIADAGFQIEETCNGYLIQITDDISDVVDNFDLFSKRRSKLKKLFREGLFLIKD